ncbi:MAG TPA: M67 family metallopeptidase [Candidatus Nitrosotalea sp.]|nr:M67 family metallopeptidase [Candidatus Nitrosotalea sp.]
MTGRDISISESHLELLKRHSKEGAPNESCAILLGRPEGVTFSVKDVILAENVAKSPVMFSISGEELIRAYAESEKRGLEVAIFHSHPASAPYPSVTDIKYMEVNPVPWVIYSNLTGETRAYILESGIVNLGVRVL